MVNISQQMLTKIVLTISLMSQLSKNVSTVIFVNLEQFSDQHQQKLNFHNLGYFMSIIILSTFFGICLDFEGNEL